MGGTILAPAPLRWGCPDAIYILGQKQRSHILPGMSRGMGATSGMEMITCQAEVS